VEYWAFLLRGSSDRRGRRSEQHDHNPSDGAEDHEWHRCVPTSIRSQKVEVEILIERFLLKRSLNLFVDTLQLDFIKCSNKEPRHSSGISTR
jgi:hypothetical protein